jgi:hypothetical protein
VPSHATAVLALTPKIFLRFGEASGTTAADSSGLGRNGTYFGSGVAYSVADALIGDGNTAITGTVATGATVSVPNNSDFTLALTTGGRWSIEFLRRANVETTSWPSVVGNGSGQALTDWHIYYDLSNLAYYFKHNNVATASPSVANDSTWRHVVLTWDGTNLVWYINNSAGSNTPATTAGGANATALTVCDTANGTVSKASIDELAIYNTALSSGQVSTLYSSLGSLDPPIGRTVIQRQAVNRSYTY